MPSSSDLNDAEHFRKRAKEARSSAEKTGDARTKSLMLAIAESYEQIATSREKVAKWENRWENRLRDAK
jgi:DNA-binding ferritin-like protein